MRHSQVKSSVVRWVCLSLITSLLVSLLVAWYQQQANNRKIENAVALAADDVTDELLDRLSFYQYGLRGERGAILTAGEHGINRELVHNYFLTQEISREFPGVRNFGFIRRVPQAEEAHFIEQARADGKPDFAVHQFAPHAGERWVIQYIEPEGANAPAIGLDMASDTTRREAAEKAMLTGEPQISAPITLYQAATKPLTGTVTGVPINKKPPQSFLILMPIYRSIVTPAATAERQAALFGWSYVSLSMNDTLAGLPLLGDRFDLRLVDITRPDHVEPFYDSDPAPQPRLFEHTLQREVFGRQWQFQFSAHPGFIDELHLRSAREVFLIGTSISVLLAALAGMVGVSRHRKLLNAEEKRVTEARIAELNASLEEQVARRTAELNELNLLLGNVLHAASEVAIIATDRDGIIHVFNRGAEHLLGYSASDLIDRVDPMLIHVPEEVMARCAELRAEYAQPITGFRVLVHKPEIEGAETREWTYVRKDGSRFPVTVVVTAMYDNVGHLNGYLFIALDMTARKATEHELATSLATTHAILDTAVNPIITTNAEGVVYSMNPAGEQVFGYKVEEVIGENVRMLLSSRNQDGREVDPPQLPISWSVRKLDHGEEVMARRKDGTAFPIQISIGEMREANERRFVGIITDMSKTQEQHKALVVARNQLLLAAEVAELGIWAWDLGNDIVYWNDRMFELYGLPLALRDTGVNFNHWRSSLHPEDVDRTVAELTTTIEGGGPFASIFRIVHRCGQTRYIQAAAQIERDADGKALRLTGINRDITAQREIETRLIQAKEQSDAASEIKSSFLANMSHEIRTPMNAVLGLLQLMQRTELDARQQDYVNKIETAAKALLGVLSDILDFSKLDAGKLLLDLHPFDVEALMRELAVVLSGNVGEKNVELLFEIDPALPRILNSDRLRLQQILINLAGNAIKFTLQGEVVVSLRCQGRHGSHVMLEVSVRDTGIGIAPEQLDRIFESFNQAEASTTRRFGGSGLGLSISKRLVTMFGGDLRVESVPGAGSRFTFCISIEAHDALPAAARQPMFGRSLKVLVVDDNPVALQITTTMARDLGWQVEEATTGEDAYLRVMQAQSSGPAFDVVLMDWRMPGMDGLAAAAKLRSAVGVTPPPIVVMLTAFGREVLTRVHATETAPFTDFLIKPITPHQLAEAVAQVIGVAPIPSGRRVQKARTRRLEGLNLLVVEDNALNRRVADELLSSEGARVSLAECGIDGVNRVLGGQRFDAVIMDIQMPDIDGMEATRRIRAHAQFGSLPILAMTANASRADRQACLAGGMSEHLGKPIDMEQLIPLLLRLTGRIVETNPENDNVEERFARPDIHLSSAIKRFGNDRILYERELANFVPECQRLLNELQEHAARGDTGRMAASLHSIKGVAASLGALSMAQLAGTIEQRIKQASLSNHVVSRTVLSELHALLESSHGGLAEALSSLTDRAAEVETDSGMPIHRMDRAKLEAILTFLNSGDMRAVDMVEALSHRDDVVSEATLRLLVRQVHALDFPAAAQTLQKFMSS
ncbi:CHASE domain-containing protein [Pararobbsia alpina]|uniref:Virulence sensor protein BvgS n=1 Tax=Pararobbsia alpina TaxID=621374 RepID=A0A6S7BC42_9BURK|nr:response regulator [Pararobbsia alpina]CAB3793240.1 Sensor histidine kinase RcsC [Pararobbsia alpina]